MARASIAYRSYRRTRHAWAGFALTHGHYDGLTTGDWAHAHMQLFVPLKGRVHLAVGDDGQLIGPERAALLPAGVAHAASTLGAELEFLALDAPADWLQVLGAELGMEGPAAPGARLLEDSGVYMQARQLARAIGDRRPGFERFVRAGVEQLGLYALQAVATPRASEGTGVMRAIETILRDYRHPLTVAGLAAESAMSARQLERRFQAEVGMPPRRFLIAVRLAAARELLATTDRAVEAIAAEVGFADASHFARAFRQATGLTPTAYRRTRRANDRTAASPE